MSLLLRLFANNILPILLVATAGFLLSRYFQINPQALSQVIFYAFSPSLLFDIIVNNELSGAFAVRIVGLAVIQMLCLAAITLLIGRALQLSRRTLFAVLLTTLFMNAGNFGLSLNLFAFGEETLAYASLFFATQGVLSYTIGVLIASLGSISWKGALVDLLKTPMIYAIGLALVVSGKGWSLPLPLDRSVELLAQASIPAMLILLGLQLERTQWHGRSLGPLALSNGLRLLAAPALALFFASLLGLQGPARQAGVVENAMPTAVMTIVLATKYDLEPTFVTSTVFASTLLSPLTLTLLLAYLGA